MYNEINYVVPDNNVLNPDWMKGMLPGTSIVDIKLPGTHDSLAFNNLSTELFHEHASFVKYMNKMKWIPGLCKKISRWVKTQPFGIYQQLLYGIRFFDFRIVETYKGQCCGYHTFITSDMVRAIHDIVKFLNEHPSEIIVIHFRCYRDQCRKVFYDLLNGKFLNPTLESMKLITFEKMKSDNKQIIVTEYGSDSDFIEGTWVDTFNTEEKIAHLSEEINIPHEKMLNLEWTLTPGIRQIILDTRSIISVSSEFNQLLETFLNTHKTKIEKNVNIVSIDDFRSVDLVKLLYNNFNYKFAVNL